MTIASSAARPLRSDSIFFPAMAAAMALTVFIGFAQSWFLKSVFHAPPEITPLIAVHGAVFTCWIGLLMVQTGLVATDRRDLHRSLGFIGIIVAVVMVVLGIALATDALRRGFTPPGGPPPAVFYAVPIGDMAAFPVLIALGYVNRRRAGAHKRYMLLATALLLDAAVARFPFDFIANGGAPVFFGLADLFVLPVAAYDYATSGRVHRATLISAAIIIGSQVLRLIIGGTAWWQAFANSIAH